MTEVFEYLVRETARHLPYPPTPYVRAVPPRAATVLRPRYAALILLVFAVSSMAVPGIRAAVLDFLQIGRVTILLDGTGAQGEPLKLAEVGGETTLAEAQVQLAFALLTAPAHPPDRVYVQDGQMAILIWLAEDHIERALYQIAGFDWAVVKHTGDITSTQIGPHSAVWVEVPHPVEFVRNGVLQPELTNFVEGQVLIWDQDGITYRLETNASLEEARAFAEALVPVQS